MNKSINFKIVFAAMVLILTGCKYHMISRENLIRPQMKFFAKEPLSYSFHDYTNWRIKPVFDNELKYNSLFANAKEIENLEQAQSKHIVFAFSWDREPPGHPHEVILEAPALLSLTVLPGYFQRKCNLTVLFYVNRAYSGRFEVFDYQHNFLWLPAMIFQSKSANSEILQSLFFRTVRSAEFKSFMEEK